MGTMTNRQRVWIDGQLLDSASEKSVSAIDHGIVVGDGVFEALKVEAGGPFALTRHLHRLNRSTAAVGLPEPDHDAIRSAVTAVLADRDWEHGRVRITWTGGEGPLGSGEAWGPGTLIVAAEPMERSAETTAIATLPWTRNPQGALAGVKSTSYGENVRGLAFAHAQDATEGIFTNTDDNLAEGTGSNIFCVFGRRIVTPPLAAGILDGITRRLAIEWWAADGHREVEVRDLDLGEAKEADEVFLTSSTRDIQAVTRWDDDEYPHGKVTKEIAQVFRAGWQRDLDPV